MRGTERTLWIAGLIAVVSYGAIRGYGQWAGQSAIAEFRAERASAPAPAVLRLPDPLAADRSDWSDARKRRFGDSLTEGVGPALAVLRIPAIGLEVAVFDGTGESVLNRGVGRIPGTARPGRGGNLGLAGHRDGFFRRLGKVGRGDALELELPGGTERYTVTETRIVKPEDVGMLAPTAESSVTLVTCFPFYFVGSAPERYVVRAVRRGKE